MSNREASAQIWAVAPRSPKEGGVDAIPSAFGHAAMGVMAWAPIAVHLTGGSGARGRGRRKRRKPCMQAYRLQWATPGAIVNTAGCVSTSGLVPFVSSRSAGGRGNFDPLSCAPSAGGACINRRGSGAHRRAGSCRNSLRWCQGGPGLAPIIRAASLEASSPSIGLGEACGAGAG